MTPSRLLAAVLVLLAATFLSASPVFAAGDADLPAGHFYTQANGGAGGEYGFRISDEGGIGFWSEYQRLGGPAMLGYPISKRFMLDGYMVQATQKVILQWRPDASPPQAYFVNIFDKFHDLGLDGALQSTYQIPPPLDPAVFDAGKGPDQARADRLTLLNADTAIAGRYNAVGAQLAVQFNGLPTSTVTSSGPFLTLRAQRTAMQHWLVANPAAGIQKGDVSVVNAGDIAKQLGVIPADAGTPENINGQSLPVAPPAAGPQAAAGSQPAPPVPAAPTPTPAPGLSYRSKEITQPPLDCSPDPLGSALPCIPVLGNLNRLYVKGRVMSAKGDHLQWIPVRAQIGDQVFDQQTVGDGTFDFTIANGCPNYAINVSVWVLDNAGRQVSDTKTVYYSGNCYVSGEFHFDFVRNT
jgi:hypothetical protein